MHKRKMKTKDFYFDLPEELIAQRPCGIRGEDRLLCLDRRTFSGWLAPQNAEETAGFSAGTVPGLRDCMFRDLPDLVPEGALMVFNNSKVRRARIYGISEETGARAEFLLVSPLPASFPGAENGSVWKVMTRRAKRRRPGQRFRFPDGVTGTIQACAELEGSEFRLMAFDAGIDDCWLETHGHIPLPPYIRREDTEEDSGRYQTVYAGETGSMAAPTAGLHFTEEILSRLDARGIQRVTVTLHVGLGTFLPVRTENVQDHRMHEEFFTVPEETADAVTRAKREGRPILAVGTTGVRTLESAWDRQEQRLRAGPASTSIFIYPGYPFQVVDVLFTNFHTPESSLIMLVSAFAGRKEILTAYRYAVEKRYRFFSYGDSMLIL